MNTKSQFKKRSIAVVLITILLLAVLPVTAVFAASAGANYPGTAAGTNWTNPNNIGADDTNYATYVIPISGTSDAINASNYGFALPANATVSGITVEIGRASSAATLGNSINDTVVQLLKAGIATGDNKATTTDWGTSQETATYGSPSDLWGTTWTAADINNGNFGVTLSAVNQSGFGTRTASVDFIRITVAYNETGATNAGTGSDVTGVGTVTWNNPGNVVSNNNSYATAAVNGTQTHYLQATNYGFNIPSGSTILGIQATIGRFENNTGGGADVRDVVVSLIKGGTVSGDNKANTGTDWPTSETAAVYGSSSDLWGLTWTPDDINASNFGLALSVNSSNNRTASVDYIQINVTYSLPADTPTVSNSPQTYTGSPINITVSCASGGTATDINPATATNAGDYAVTADCPGGGGYSATDNANAGTFTVSKATPTASITNTPVTYDGTLQTATVACLGGGTATLAGGGSGTDAGNYPATVDCAASTNYNAASGLTPTNDPFVINKATPTASITNTPVTYDGTLQTATVACLGGGTATLAGGGSGTDAGNYPATVDCAASTNYNAASGLTPTNDPFVINKATPTASITNTPVTYDGTLQTATVACLGGGTATLAGGGSGTDAGNYPATVDCAASTNYNAASGLTPTNDPFVINKAPPTASITNTPVTYDGTLQTATVACLGGGTATLAGGGSGTDAGNYPATVDCAASTNYNAASGLTPTNDPFVINKANQATLSITGPSGITVGAVDVDITTSGGSGSGTVTFDVGASTDCSIVANKLHAIMAGNSCSVTATKAADTNYNQATSAAFPVIVSNKLVPTVSTSSGPFTYDGTPHAAVVNGSVAGTVSDVKYNGSATVPTDAGTYNVTADFLPSDTNTYETLNDAAAGSITINKAALTVTANNQTIISGNPDPDFTFGYSGFVNSETSAVLDTQPVCSVAGAHSAPGAYPIVCSGGADNNYSFAYVNGTLTVNAANNPPTDIALSNSSINENQAVGTLVGTLSTTDPDLGDSFTYSFCGGADDASFSISGSSLLSAASFDFETKNSYSICVRTTDSGALTTTKTFAISINNLVDTQTFQDVPMSYWAWSFIERLYAAGITGGCSTSPLNYCPTSPVTRAQMAVFLLKGIHGPSYAPPAVGNDTGFTDVATDYWAAAWIKQLAAEGITGGCGAGIYCPENTVTRAQMAVFLLKATHGSAFVPPAATGVFTDVATDYWAAAWIEQLAAEGITSGCAVGTYCPENPVTRDQMAVFLVKAFNLP